MAVREFQWKKEKEMEKHEPAAEKTVTGSGNFTRNMAGKLVEIVPDPSDEVKECKVEGGRK